MNESDDTEPRYSGWFYENSTVYGHVEYVQVPAGTARELGLGEFDFRIDTESLAGYGVDDFGTFVPVTFAVEREGGEPRATDLQRVESE
jgi:hypothetical protein